MKPITKILLMIAALIATSIMALATNVTLKVTDSQGNPISGVPISIFKANVGGVGTHNTNGIGEITVDLTNYTLGYGFTARYAYSSAYFAKPITSADEGTLIHTFQTVEAKFAVTDCNNTPLSGFVVDYWVTNSGGGTVGTTGPTGIVSKELFPGTYGITARINRTSQTVNVDIAPTGIDHTFKPTQVNLSYSGPISIWIPNNGGINVVPGIYMFPGTYNFNFGFATFPLTISGCTFGGVANIIKVLDHNNNPIAGATARGGVGAGFGTWHVSGSTNASGCLLDLRPLPASASGYSYEARVNGTTKVVGPLTNNNFLFKTDLLTLRLETCAGLPLEGGHVRWGIGTNYGSSHFIGGNTSAAGETSAEMFPGTYSFEMGYKATVDYKISYNFPADGAKIVFKTTKVTLVYNGSIRYGGAAGISNHFVKPSMELMPGATVKFEFSVGGTVVDIPIAGCDISKVMLQVKNELNGGVAGATFTPAIGGSWQSTLAGVSDANGCLFADLNPSWTKIRAGVGNSSQELTKAQLEANGYKWTTQVLRVNLKDHAGALITAGDGSLSQGGGTWISMGNFGSLGYINVSTFPASARYRVTYNGTSQTIDGINVIAGAGVQQFDFQTGQVFGSCITQYSTGTWRTFTDGMELMPGTYTFKSPSQSGTVTAGAITNLTCSSPMMAPANTGTPTQLSKVEFVVYPNPFSQQTTIQYTLTADDAVSISILDANGREVALLYKGFRTAGQHNAVWEAATMPSGVYYLRILSSEGATNSAIIKE